MAIALWIFMAVWLAMLGALRHLFARDGSPPEVGVFGPPLLGLFWLAESASAPGPSRTR
jgi:FtsH-binding integral membrane protein